MERLFSVDMYILRQRGSEYWMRWRETYCFRRDLYDGKPWPAEKPMSEEELKKFMENKYEEA